MLPALLVSCGCVWVRYETTVRLGIITRYSYCANYLPLNVHICCCSCSLERGCLFQLLLSCSLERGCLGVRLSGNLFTRYLAIYLSLNVRIKGNFWCYSSCCCSSLVRWCLGTRLLFVLESQGTVQSGECQFVYMECCVLEKTTHSYSMLLKLYAHVNQLSCFLKWPKTIQ